MWYRFAVMVANSSMSDGRPMLYVSSDQSKDALNSHYNHFMISIAYRWYG